MKRHKITEEELIRLLRIEDANAMTILYDNYSSALYGVIFRVVQSQETAEDVLQESFVKIWKNFSQYDNTKGKLFTWLLNICRNMAIDKVRSKDFSNANKNQDIENTVSFIDMNHNHSYNPDHIGMRELVQKLIPEQKKIIDLLYFKGYTQAEVAEELNMPLGTVKTRARLAINTLRKDFEMVKEN